MNLIQESFQRLFPDKEFPYHAEMEYNRRLSDFNANIRLQHHRLSLHLNLQWKDIDEEIKIGLIQHLLLRIFKQRANTPNIELYNNFIKNIPILTIKTKNDPWLEQSFQRVNQTFFSNGMEQPNLTWGNAAFRKLASYNFHNDTITVSSIFNDAKSEILDYLMYHELLHKHHQFKHHNGRSSFHTREFRAAEEAYPQHTQIEQEINTLVRAKKKTLRKKSFWSFF